MIDWNRVLELREEVGAEDFDEVVDLFLDEVQEVILRLQDHPDPTQLEADFHFLKGSALNLGFDAFAALCEAGESKASADNDASGDLPDVLTCYASSREVFLKDLSQKLTSPAA